MEKIFRQITVLALCLVLSSCGGVGSGKKTGDSATDLSVISTGPHPAFPDGLSLIAWNSLGQESDNNDSFGNLYLMAPSPNIDRTDEAEGNFKIDNPTLWKMQSHFVDLGCDFAKKDGVAVNSYGDHLKAQTAVLADPTVICNDVELEYNVLEGQKEQDTEVIDLKIDIPVTDYFWIRFPDIPEDLIGKVGIVWKGKTVKYFYGPTIVIGEPPPSSNPEEWADLLHVFSDEPNSDLLLEFTFSLSTSLWGGDEVTDSVNDSGRVPSNGGAGNPDLGGPSAVFL